MKRILGALVVTVFVAAGAIAAQPDSHVTLFLQKGEVFAFEVNAGGDFFETAQPTAVEFRAKQDIWVRVSGEEIELSLDGVNYRSISEVATGKLEIGTKDASTFTMQLTTKAK